MLHIRLLGTFALTDGEVPIDTVNSTRLQALLAYLVLNSDAPQPRHHLAYLFWPDSSESQARTNLRKLFYQLRQALPKADCFLRYDSHTLQWNTAAAYTLDVANVQGLLEQVAANPLDRDALVQVAECYRGELLPSCYDDWILMQRQQLQDAVLAALEQLVILLENQRAYAEGIRFAQRLLALDPLAETSYQRLMRLRALKGDRSGALRAYHDCVTMLRQELAVEPSPETQQAYERILNKEVTPAPKHPALLAEATQLVGRVPEWQTLQAVWQQAVQGDAHLVVLKGEAGIGKTRLAEELLAWAGHQGMSTARARSYMAQGALAYAPVADLLRTPTLRAGLAKLEPVWLGETARLLPELLTLHSELPDPQPLTEPGQRRRFFEALVRALLATDQPLLLLLDDLQWCDHETLAWLQYLLHAAPTARLLVVSTVRDDEVGPEHPVTALQLALRRTGQLTDIPLTPLDTADATALAAQMAGQALAAAQAEQLYRATEGNPLFVVEMVRAQQSQAGTAPTTTASTVSMVEEGTHLPPKVFDVIRARLLQLTPQAQGLVQLAATIGRSFTYDIVLAASEQDEDTLVAGLDELWQRRIVREQGGEGYDFSHDRLREVAYGQISRTRRRLLHRRVAQALASLNPSRLDAVAGEIAAHYERAGRIEQSLPYYQRAAQVAHQIGAYHEAIAYVRTGLHLLHSLPHSPAVDAQELAMLVPLGTCLVALRGYGDPEVEATFKRALQFCIESGDDPNLMPTLVGLGRFYMIRGEVRQALAIGRQGLQVAQRVQDDGLLLQAHLILGPSLQYLGALRDSVAHFEQTIALYDPLSHGDHAAIYGDEPAVAARVIGAISLYFLGYAERSLRWMEEGMALAQQASHAFSLNLAQVYAAALYYVRREPAAVLAVAEAGIELARRHGYDYWLVICTMFHGWAAAHLDAVGGEPAHQTQAMLAQMREAFLGFRRSGAGVLLPHYLSVVAEAQMVAGDREAAWATLHEALEIAQTAEDVLNRPTLHQLQGEFLLASLQPGQPAEEIEADAEAAFRLAIEIAQAQEARMLELRAATRLAGLWLRQGRQAEAQALLKPLYSWFTDGFDTPDLLEAKALLDSLASA